MIESMKRIKLAILLGSMLLILPACASMMGTSASARLSESQTQKVCALWTAVGWEDADSDATITEVKVNNAKRDTFCAGVK